MTPDSIQKLIDMFSRFPGVGPKQASRFVFFLLRQSKEYLSEFTQSVKELKSEISFCAECFFPVRIPDGLCSVCVNKARNHSILCVVEKEQDLIAIEKAGAFSGVYFILGGIVDYYDAESKNKMRFPQLAEKVKKIKKENGEKEVEVVLAISSGTEGTTTMVFIEKLLKPLGVKITRPAQGLPKGAEMEYADPETLRSALEGRKSF